MSAFLTAAALRGRSLRDESFGHQLEITAHCFEGFLRCWTSSNATTNFFRTRGGRLVERYDSRSAE
jgi:hypothetical protein